MEDIYHTNIYAGDYYSTSESKTDLKSNYKDTKFYTNNNYYLCEDNLLMNSYLENKNESTQNTFPKSNEPLQIQNEEYLSRSNLKSGNIDIQRFDEDKLPNTDRQDNISKETRRTPIKPIKPIVNANFSARPNKKCTSSHSAPSIFAISQKKCLSGEENNGNEQPKRDFRNEELLIEHPATIQSKIPENFQPPRKERNQEMVNSQRSKNFNVKIKQDARRRLKVPVKKLYVTENGKQFSREKSSIDSINEIKYAPGRRNADDVDRCSSYYSESDLRYVAKHENSINERNMPYSNVQQSLKKSIPRNSLNDNVKYISNFLHYSNNNGHWEESFNENYSKRSESRFTTDSFLRKELSDFKEFLLRRRSAQRKRNNREKNVHTVYIPERIKLQKTEQFNDRMPRSNCNNGKERTEENRHKIHPHLKTGTPHKTRRPKVSDDELLKRFEQNFRRFASTRRFSGEVIPRKISTEWMIQMGVVGDILTVKDADNEFKKAAGMKITMNIQEYKEFLFALTMKKKLPFYEIYRRMCGI